MWGSPAVSVFRHWALSLYKPSWLMSGREIQEGRQEQRVGTCTRHHSNPRPERRTAGKGWGLDLCV